MKKKKLFTYYEISCSVSEYRSEVKYRCTSFDIAMELIKDCANWFEEKGTGKIWKITLMDNEDGTISIDKQLEYENPIYKWRTL